MIPIRDDAPTRGPAVVVVFLVVVNVLVFAYELSLGPLGGGDAARLDAFVERWALVPREFLRGAADPGTTRQWVWLTPLSAIPEPSTGTLVCLGLAFISTLGRRRPPS